MVLEPPTNTERIELVNTGGMEGAPVPLCFLFFSEMLTFLARDLQDGSSLLVTNSWTPNAKP